MPPKKKPKVPQGSDRFPASTKMHNDLTKTLKSEEALKMPISEVEALIAAQGKELLEKLAEEVFAQRREAGLEQSPEEPPR